MANDKERFNKIIALAIDPGASDAEAATALRKARELVKANPDVRAADQPPSIPPHEDSVAFKLTNIAPSWLNVVTDSLSKEAYGLRLISKITYDFKAKPTAVDVRCDGSNDGCDKFKKHLVWLLDYINTQPRGN